MVGGQQALPFKNLPSFNKQINPHNDSKIPKYFGKMFWDGFICAALAGEA